MDSILIFIFGCIGWGFAGYHYAGHKKLKDYFKAKDLNV